MNPSTVDPEFERYRRTGDPDALAAVFDASAAKLLCLARHLTRDPHRAEDLVQATFVAAIEHAPSHDPGQPVLPWLCGILANRARHALRQAQRHAEPPPPGARLAPPNDAPDRAAERSEFRDIVERAVARLPARYREVVALQLLEQWSAPEIGELLGRRAGTVRMQLARGLSLLRRALPAGFGLGALLGGAGLAKVRAATLAHAGSVNGASAVVPAASVPVLGGAVVVKKVVLAVVLLVLVAGAASWWLPLATPTGWVGEAEGPGEVGPDLVVARAESAPPVERSPLPPHASARADEGDTSDADTAMGLEVRGRVEHEGQPVAGARIMAFDGGRFPVELVRSDAAGHFRLAGVPAGRTLWARAAGYAPSFPADVDGHDGATTDVVLRVMDRGHPIAGRVVDARGQALPGALVGVGVVDLPTLAGGGPRQPTPRCLHVVRADDTGAFTCAEVPAGRCLLIARPADDEDTRRAVDAAEVGPEGRRGIELRLAADTTVRGRVTDAIGRALPGAAIYASWRGTATFGRVVRTRGPRFADAVATTDEHGCFRLRGLLCGDYGLTARHRGVDVYHRIVGAAQGEALQWNPVLDLGRSLAIRVSHAGGAPLSGWGVDLHLVSTGAFAGRGGLDDAGCAVFSGLDDVAYSARLFRPADDRWGRRPFATEVFDGLIPRPTPHDLTLARDSCRTASFRARILVGEQPVAGARVQWAREHATAGEESLFTSPAGILEIAELPRGMYRADVRLADGRWARLGPWRLNEQRHDAGDVRIPASARLTVDLAFAAAPTGSAPRVKLLSATDRKVVGYLGRDADWSYGSDALSPGEYVVDVRGPGMAPIRHPVTLAAGARERVALVAAPGCATTFDFGTVAGDSTLVWYQIFDAEGERLVTGTVHATKDRPELRATCRLPRGRFVAAIRCPADGPPIEHVFTVRDERELRISIPLD